MKKYMIVYQTEDGNQNAIFTDDSAKAHDMYMDAECGLGCYVEMYERITDEDGVSSYQMIY